MSENDEGSDPPPLSSKIDSDFYQEPEDWDMPPVMTEDDECPDILENVEPEEAIETLFTNLHISTIVSLLLGIVLMIIFYVLKGVLGDTIHTGAWQIIHLIIGFVAGLMIVFGASELIILGVKGIQDKLNWNPYIGGIIQAIGAALAELVVIIILLFRSKAVFAVDPDKAFNLSTTAITLILTTVIVNIFFLGLSMIFVSKEEPFDLPKELTFFEANLILGMMVFSFVIMIYGFYFEFTDIREVIGGNFEATSFNQVFEIVIGIALILIYFIFIFILMRQLGKKTSTPQTLISEFFPEDDEPKMVEPETEFQQSRLTLESKDKEKLQDDACEQPRKRNGNNHKTDQHALATLRRWPWFIIIMIFFLGAGGIIQGGNLLAESIETGIEAFEVNILVYSVIVGIVSSSPELVVTFRGLLSREKELIETGLVHQVSAINQTFYILFGVPFLISGIFLIGIPIALEITIVMGGIFVMSIAVQMMVMDDNKFDLLEGVVITLMSIVSLLALAFIGGITPIGS